MTDDNAKMIEIVPKKSTRRPSKVHIALDLFLMCQLCFLLGACELDACSTAVMLCSIGGITVDALEEFLHGKVDTRVQLLLVTIEGMFAAGCILAIAFG